MTVTSVTVSGAGAPAVFSREKELGLRVAAFIRIALSTAFLAAYSLAVYLRIPDIPPWTAWTPYFYGAYAVSQLYLLWIVRRGREPVPGFHISNYVIDSVGITLFVYYTGGMYSPFLLIYVFAFLIASVLERARWALMVGLSQGFLFASMALGQGLGWIPVRRSLFLQSDARFAVFLLAAAMLGVANLFVLYLFRRIKVFEESGSRQYRKLNTLYDLTRGLLGRTSLDEQMEKICDTITSVLRFDLTTIFLYEEDTDSMRFGSCSPQSYRRWIETVGGVGFKDVRLTLSGADSPLTEAMRGKQLYVTDDMRALAGSFEPKFAPAALDAMETGMGPRMFYHVPLVHQEGLIGMLACIAGSSPLSGEDRAALLSYADAAALAISDARMLDELQAGRNQLEHSLEELWIANDKLKSSYERIQVQSEELEQSRREVEASEKELETAHKSLERKHRYLQSAVEISQDLHALTDPDHLSAGFARLLNRIFPVTSVAIFLRREEEVTCVGSAEFGGSVPGRITLSELRRELVWKAIQDRAIHQGVAPAWRRSFPIRQDATSVAVVPLLSGREWLGFFYFESGGPKPFEEDDLSMLTLLANQFSLAVKNSLHFEQSLFYKNYLENLIENAGVIFLVINRKGRVRLFNRHAEERSGYKREEVIGRHAARLFMAPERRAEYMRRMTALLEGKSIASFQGEFRTKKGRVRKTRFTLIPVLNARDEVEQSILMGEDITSVVELERQVIESGRLASLGQLAASVAHDLNNPLSVVNAQVQLMERELTDGDGKIAQRMKKVQAATEHIRMLIDNLMSYAKPGRERRGRVDLNDLVRETITLSEYEIRRGGVRITPQLDPNLPPINGIKGELQQVVLNLLVNANRAIRELSARSGRNNHRGEIHVETAAGGDGRVILTVSDNGVGMTVETQKNIFTPFFTTWSSKEGSGLGLAAVQRIVQRHAGRVIVKTTHLKGCRFEIDLPISGSPSPT